ncbi:hypothetical protein SADUNF_Sadunf16G0178200 [Salix dunnii]|uniref:Uncharacterized protein n=1 Tax=Salix dunnii TaxID=1413687 RepID=A0A835MQJ8_9ROSI|nr:hypothetical protein SADUNF_Sadunf16G0178200 [Salix dunnii]
MILNFISHSPSRTTGNDVEDRSRYSPFALEGRYRQGISMEEIQTDNVDLRILETNCSSFEIYCHYVSRPIEHDTPIIPYIPGLTPPHPQKHGRFDSSPPA